MILYLLSTANFYITILNRKAWFDISIFHWFYYFSRDFYNVEKTNKTGFLFSSFDIYEHFSIVHVIFIIMD